MPTVRLEASEEAQGWARELCGKDAPTLDAIHGAYNEISLAYARLADELREANALLEQPAHGVVDTPEFGGISGEPPDQVWVMMEVCRLLRIPKVTNITLAQVREALKLVGDEHAALVAQAMRATAPGHHEDDCADTILSLCPDDVHQMFALAEETWGSAGLHLGKARIIASVLTANRHSLHAGDVTELNPVAQIKNGRVSASPTQPAQPQVQAPRTCPENEIITVNVDEYGPVTMNLKLCGHTFTPKHLERYGCSACGEIAHKAKIWLIEQTELVRRRIIPSLQQIPPYRVPQELRDACTCNRPVPLAPSPLTEMAHTGDQAPMIFAA